MKKILLFICLFAYLTNSFSQNLDKRQEEIQVVEKEINKFINANFLGIKLTQKEIKKIRSEDEHEEHLSIQDIENMQIALERDRLRLLFFKKYPDKKAVYLASTYSKNTRQTGCVNGGFENGTTGYNFLSATNWDHPGGFNVNFGNPIGAPFGPFTPANVAITNTGNNDPFIGVISEVFAGNHSLRLNPNVENSAENATVMTRNFNINQPVLSLNFAFILETSHDDPIIDSFVRFEVYDTVLNQIVDSRVITAGDAAFNITNPWRWADWSCINLNVAESIDHDAILRVYVSDCAYTQHDSILYLDDICNNGVPCTNVAFGEIVLDPQGFDCPVDLFQVCGTFIAPNNAVSTAIELEILDANNNITATLTNPVINTNTGTFCFTVNPSFFGTNPTGNYEFNATAQFTLNNGGVTTDFDLSSVQGPDITFDDCCNINASPNFTMTTNCENGNFCVTATASDLTAGNHWWGLIETSVEGSTSGADTIDLAQPVQFGTSATFCWLDVNKHYYIKHGIWDDCYNWREVRIPVEKFDAEAIFNLETADGTVKDVFCYGEDVFMDGTASYGENRYYIDVWRRPKGSTQIFDPYAGLGWALNAQVGVINLTQALANLSPAKEFTLEYEYKVKLAIANLPNCIPWTPVEHTFTIECCDGFFNADFTGRIADDGIIDVYNFDLYDNVNAVHEWYVLSSPNHNAGPYTPVYSGTSTGAYTANNSLELVTNAQSGLHYTVIHKVITDCGEVCTSDELHFDKFKKEEAPEKVDACCLAFEYWPNGPGNPPTTFTAEFDGSISSNGTLDVENFETYANAGATHEWHVYSSPNEGAGPYTFVTMVTSTTQITVVLLNNAQSGLNYTIIHKVITDCLTECLDKEFRYKNGILSEAPSSSKGGDSLPDPCCIANEVVITANGIDITDTKTYTIPCGERGVTINTTNLENVQYTSPDPVLFGGGNFGVPNGYQGSSFRVYITGIDSCGNPYRERLLIKIEPCCNLPAPTNVRLRRGRYLFWDSVPGAVSYIISPSLVWDRTCTCRNPVSLRPIETTNHYTLLPSTANGRCFMVRVAAVCANGAISDYSEDICIGGDRIIDGGGVGAVKEKQLREVSITPNPTRGEMTFNIMTNMDTEVNVDVYDAYGTLIKSFVEQVVSDKKSAISWNGSNLRKGIYFVNFRTKEETVYKQVIIK